jgi:hypothetical protein
VEHRRVGTRFDRRRQEKEHDHIAWLLEMLYANSRINAVDVEEAGRAEALRRCLWLFNHHLGNAMEKGVEQNPRIGGSERVYQE